MDEDINNFIPSLLYPRTVPKESNGNLTQTSISRCSLSLRKSITKDLRKAPNFISNQNVTANFNAEPKAQNEKDNIFDVNQNLSIPTNDVVFNKDKKHLSKDKTICSSIRDLDLENIHNSPISLSFGDTIDKHNCYKQCENSLFDLRSKALTISSATDLIDQDISKKDSDSTKSYSFTEKRTVSVSFGLVDSTFVKISTVKNKIKNVMVHVKDNITNVDLEIVEGSQLSLYKSDSEEIKEEHRAKDITMPFPSSPKNIPAAVNLEIKKKSPEDSNAISLGVTENSKVLILNTSNARLSHVIVQPPNYNLLKRKIPNARKFTNSAKKQRFLGVQNVQCRSSLKQSRIDQFLVKKNDVVRLHGESERTVVNGTSSEDVASEGVAMSRNTVNSSKFDHRVGIKSSKEIESSVSNRALTPKRGSPKHTQLKQHVKAASIEAKRNQSADSSKKNGNTFQFNLHSKTVPNSVRVSSVASRTIPSFKIVAGTHFAVDAFSYGEIPNISHYFLTHFHSDHYCGLKKSFNKTLFCSKITAELCVSRLGVNPSCIRVFNCDETITVDNVVVTAVDANHCPGALMLVFSLANGKTILHTGDFRASPLMESYPIFWNKNIHTIYLDTTYCNPRYDFPTQEQSLEMALHLLREKKIALEKASKKFSSVLIVCGTYTIGKEKFFLGLSRRVGCSVWACPEKDRVLQAVEGRSFSHAPPQDCQLHIVPMRDLTHEKLQDYLTSLQGAFSEVVAFKPSGWENGKNSTVVKDSVTIHGIPYSEHSSFSEMIRFVKFLRPKQVVPTVDIVGGIKTVQKYFPCPLVTKDLSISQSRLTSFYSKQSSSQLLGSAAS